MSRSHRARITLGLLTASLAFSACGSNTTESQAASPTAAASAPAPAALLSANSATKDELQTIPGVGAEIADEIMEYRPYDAETGPDKFRDELSKYIDDAEVERIMAYLDFAA